MSNSRIARKPVKVPSGVDIKLSNVELSIKGPKGQANVKMHPYVSVVFEDNEIKIKSNPNPPDKITGKRIKLYRSLPGTMRANINNSVTGVATGFEKKLVMIGVGYRAQAKGKMLSLSLGFSHPVEYHVPEGIIVETPTQTEINVKGIDRRLVGQVAADIRAYRPPEQYKGKGVRYKDEIVVIKETKKK